MITNFNNFQLFSNSKPVWDLEIVPTELTSKIEIDFGDGYCLSRIENIIKSPIYSMREALILRYISEDRPDLLVASEQVRVCGFMLGKIIEEVEFNKTYFEPTTTYVSNCSL